jgi:LysM repeat protein
MEKKFMFNTNDVYNDAVRDSSIHVEDNNVSWKASIGSKLVAIVLLTAIVYVGFKFYNLTGSIDETLVVESELIADSKIESKSLTVEKFDNSEEDYLSALRGIESELTEKREAVRLDTSEQMSLSLAMNDLMEDGVLVDNTSYTNELRKEIGIAVDKSVGNENVIIESTGIEEHRTVIVKKGDTLQGISNKFYGNAMNYKRIIASNDSLISNDTIYVGQTILLPY